MISNQLGLLRTTMACFYCLMVVSARPCLGFRQPFHFHRRSQSKVQFSSSTSSSQPEVSRVPGLSEPLLTSSLLQFQRGVRRRQKLQQLSSSTLHNSDIDDDDDDDGEIPLAATDRAPCFDNGVCLSFPDDQEGVIIETGAAIHASDHDDMHEVITPNRVAINSSQASELVPGRNEGVGGGAIERLGGTATGPTVWSEFGRLAAEYNNSNSNLANLGQGFPDWPPPEFAVQSLVSAATDTSSTSSPHQYTRTAGHPNLVKQLARRYSKHLDQPINPMAEVAVTVGASQALYLCLQTLVQPGEEVILFEPFFDLYVNQIKLAGGTPVYVPLTFVPHNHGSRHDGDDDDDGGDDEHSQGRGGGGGGGGKWILESNKLRDKLSSTKTRAIILNSPHNPTGKVFTQSEMLDIARIVTEVAGPQCVVLSDEVYKYIVHSPPRDDEEDDGEENGDAIGNNGAAIMEDGLVVEDSRSSKSCSISASKNRRTTSSCPGHVHFASLPNMWERTITISSAGKTFSATGWQVGWCIGPARLISPIHQLLPYVQFCASTVIQEALARTLPRADEPHEGYASYYEYLNEKYRRKRDLLSKALKDVGFAVPDYDATPGWGGFFIFAQITPEVQKALPSHRLQLPHSANPAAPGGRARLDWALCQWMVEELGVLCIPSSSFFSKERALEGASDEFIRVAFCKTDETIERAAFALRKLASHAKEKEDINVEKEDVDGVLVKEVLVATAGR